MRAAARAIRRLTPRITPPATASGHSASLSEGKPRVRLRAVHAVAAAPVQEVQGAVLRDAELDRVVAHAEPERLVDVRLQGDVRRPDLRAPEIVDVAAGGPEQQPASQKSAELDADQGQSSVRFPTSVTCESFPFLLFGRLSIESRAGQFPRTPDPLDCGSCYFTGRSPRSAFMLTSLLTLHA